MKLTESLPTQVEVQGITFDIDFSFDNILLFREMLSDADLTNDEKVIIGLEMLVMNYKDVKKLNLDDQVTLFLRAFDCLKESDDEEQGEGTGQKTYDFDQDADFIYASFLMDYGIDLMAEQGNLHWKKFIALLNGLSDRTPFMKVLDIRTRPLPKPSKHNAEERKQLQRLKRKYALEQTEQDISKSMNQAANFLRQKAGGK